MPEINLVFDEPVQRKKAPKHLADFAPADRKAFAKELGFQPFRASQVANHYFSHLSANPEDWTDIPAAERQAIADALIPKNYFLISKKIMRPKLLIMKTPMKMKKKIINSLFLILKIPISLF